MNTLRICLLVLMVLPVLAHSGGPAPWEAADSMRRELGKVERLLMGETNEAITQQAKSQADKIIEHYQLVLAQPIAQQLPGLDQRIQRALSNFRDATARGDAIALASARQHVWTSLLEAGLRLTGASVRAGNAEKASEWLGLREYARTGAGTLATEAMDNLKRGDSTPEQGWRDIKADLLQTYASELRRAIKEARKAVVAGYKARVASWAARAHGLGLILDNSLQQQLGDKASVVQQWLEQLDLKASQGELSALPELLDMLDARLATYAPTTLPLKETERLSNLLLRFIKLIDFDYNIGVRDGQVVIPLDYREAVIFRNRAEMLVGDLQGEFSAGDAQRLRDLLKQMQPIIQSKGSGEEITVLSKEAADIVRQAFSLTEDNMSYQAAFQLLPETLDQIADLAGKGDFEAAELKRLEAYAFFDPDIEQHLMPRAPSLALTLESLFWEGGASQPGLQRLLAQKKTGETLDSAISLAKEKLAEAESRLMTEAGPAATFLQSLAIMLREGLEAVLVIAALLGVMRAMNAQGYARYIWGGVVSGVVASFALWYAASEFLTVTTLQRELLEGLTALLAAAVLVYVTHWIFHKTYVVQWVEFVREQVERSVSKGHLMSVGLVSFFVIFREGFETVLFYQAMLLESPPHWVLGGFVAGVAGTAAIAWALLKLGRRLPINKFFAATGVLLMLLALVFTGFGIRGLQTAGLVSATPVPGFPEWPFLQLYIGLFPTWESLLAQLALLGLFFGGWLWIRLALRRTATV